MKWLRSTLLAALAILAVPAVLAETIGTSPIVVAVGAITGLGSNVATFLATPSSANLAAALTDKTGTGVSVFGVASTAWTPVLAFGGASVGITYTAQTGFYSELGPVVVASANITLSSKGSSTGTALITGLPDSSSLTSQGCALANGGSFASLTGQMVADVSSNTIRLFNVTTAASFAQTSLADTNFTATTTFRVTCVYLK